MDTGFIILRHVTSRMTDLYWKECYRCIRKWYPDAPVMIVDDSSSSWLREDIMTTRCTVVYDREHPGRGELLPYLYFHRLKPFRRAVILHDSVFLQTPLPVFSDVSGCRFLWSIPHRFDGAIQREIGALIDVLPDAWREEVRGLYERKAEWCGAFGVMSVVSWEWLDAVVGRYDIFRWLPLLQKRDDRSALERVLGVVAHHHGGVGKALHGDIFDYMRWGVTFPEWLEGAYEGLPLVKVWTGR
jgi:hypothetical protein